MTLFFLKLNKNVIHLSILISNIEKFINITQTIKSLWEALIIFKRVKR